jgi:hypothetical protein
MKRILKFETLSTIIITLYAVFQGQITVFYIVCLFWCQELILSILELVQVLLLKIWLDKPDYIPMLTT